jgi:hypothetical protein
MHRCGADVATHGASSCNIVVTADATLKRWWTQHCSNGRCSVATHNAIVRDVVACNTTFHGVVARSAIVHLGSQSIFYFFFLLDFGNFKNLQGSSCVTHA